MKRDLLLTKPITSSFLSCEKDTELILRKLFIESRPYSDILKRLLVVQAPDALDKNYDVSGYSLKRLLDEQYINLDPLIKLPEHDQIKSFIGLHFDNFTPNATNPEFRDCMIHIDVLCHHDYWDLGNYRQRPFKILGYIDGLMNNSKLTGIGQINFVGCSKALVGDQWSAFALTYMAIHGSDDQLLLEEDDEE